ncbi:clathrin interactor EPSIN 2-like isoform X2 [Olea europaea var. sylvestris]|uniref:clathrin interactor EPSIN 2-like isoform X2 n=1 Tax=Olea europaea var. sylvestris TaxID=158386 RepID=UPI000C1D4886|nr:clathrin interactor EPSIN 2-like isoform X2 [Olea europaea var. sylvestris]
MKKAFDQTVRDIKREVNKKVLKVPSIEQKVLDATSNEPWGPHGSLLADIAQATRNYHEYQMIMSVIWKRINDTGKNWRHVYKALTVLEYLVAHGSERVIDEIREHAYQISTLSDFQYIDSSGKDQGNNVRKKSQSLVVLVNDKERIQEVRQKAAANRDKYRNTSIGNMYRPGSYSSGGGYGDRYDEDRYGSRDDDRNGYGREREWGQRDDDRYGRYGDSYGRDEDRYSKEYEERSGRGGYRDDEYRGRSRSIDNYQYGSRSRSADRDRDRAYEDDGQYSSRGSGAKADDHSQDGRPFDRKYSEQNLNAPPSYEEAVNGARSPTYSERDGEPSQASAPKASSPPSSASPSNAAGAAASSPAPAPAPAPAPDNKKVDGFDEFDPRGSVKQSSSSTTSNVAAPTTAGGAEMDLLDSLALVPVTQQTTASEADGSVNSSHGPAFVATSSQPFGDPFGDGPFIAVTSTNSVPAQQQIITSASSFHLSSSQSSDPPQPIPLDTTTAFGGTQSPQQKLLTQNQDFDILADILPPSGSSLPVNSQAGYPVQASQPALQSGFASQPGQPSLQTTYPLQPGQSVSMASTFPAQAGQASEIGFPPQSGQPASLAGFPSQTGSSESGIQTPFIGQSAGSNANFYGGQFSSAHGSQSVLPSSTMSTAIVPQPTKDKFETKSTVWADTLSRGLVNLNISGAKTNPLADIGVDFDAINRKERRMEKPTASTATSNVTMGKAMGSGSGIGRAGAGALRPPHNPMMGSGMGIGGMTVRPGMGIGMGGYGVNQQPMGMGQGVHMQQQTGFPPVTRPGGYNYNPTMGTGDFNQQPYGGGY